MPHSLISGISGQDGSYLAELLLGKGYEVTGIYRRSSTPNFSRLKKIIDNPKLTLFEGDITDYSFVYGIVVSKPFDEIYNLAAQSHVGSSFTTPIYTTEVNYIGCLNFLEILAALKPTRDRVGYAMPKFYQASTSEMFGSNYSTAPYNPDTKEIYSSGFPMSYNKFSIQLDYKYQDETTPFAPNSPYAIAKLAAHNAVKVYREAYGLHASCGILFNHESPRRGDEFVTKKVTNYARTLHKYKAGTVPKLKLGNLEAQRDWGYAPDYVEGMWLMLQQTNPDDYVLATGETHSVLDLLKEAFGLVNQDYKEFVELDSTLRRPSEVPFLRGSYTKAKEKLGWEPKVKFKDLIDTMIRYND